MRAVTAPVALLVGVLAVACGSPRRVVIEPDAVPGRKGDTWRVTSEPAASPAADGASETTAP